MYVHTWLEILCIYNVCVILFFRIIGVRCPRHVTAKEVSDISGVAEGTIAQCVRDLQDALPHLIPATYATAAEIKATFPSS